MKLRDARGSRYRFFIIWIKKSGPDIEVRIKYKTENCNDLYLKLSGISECREVTSVDTFRLSVANTWRVARRSVDIASPLLLGVALEAQGEKPGKRIFRSIL